ncbi:MAG: Ig-like domain-containing protein, partial [Gemmatimonadales bacterium]
RFSGLEITGAAGAHTLIFSASGLQSVTSNAVTVSPAGTTTRITSDGPDPSAPGQGVTVTFEVTSPGGTPTGTVQVTASGGAETCSAEVSAGQCVITLTGEGSRTLTASYQGNSTFQSSNDNTAHNVVTPDTPPTAADDNYSTPAGVTLSVPAGEGVLSNDDDVDGDAMRADVVPDTGPDRGTLAFRSDGSFDYTPSLLFFGQDQFDYEVTAGGASNRATVRIIVN